MPNWLGDPNVGVLRDIFGICGGPGPWMFPGPDTAAGMTGAPVICGDDDDDAGGGIACGGAAASAGGKGPEVLAEL